jgi:tRNA (guanine-N7-)-methyltransferase
MGMLVLQREVRLSLRIRQHVNPLARKFQQPVPLPDWSSIYANPALPLHLDIGCARGRFLLAMAQQYPDWNYLGLEIRQSLVDEANQCRDHLGLGNLYYLFCNVNVSVGELLQSLPAGCLHRVSIQFPDPWFKKKHHKRRVLQPQLVTQLAQALPAGAEVIVQSDVEAIEQEMCDRLAVQGAFRRTSPDWLPANPLPLATEREISVQRRGLNVYRAVFVRQADSECQSD